MTKNIKHITLFILFAFGTINATSQSTFDKLLFEEAQQAYTNGEYEVSLKKISELEQREVQGPLILHLKIMATTSLPFETLSSERVLMLHKDVEYYLTTYDNEDFINQYRDVYEIKKILQTNPHLSSDSHIKKINSKDLINLVVIPESYIVFNFALLFGVVFFISYLLHRKSNKNGSTFSVVIISIIVFSVYYFVPWVYRVNNCGKIDKGLLISPHKTATGYQLSFGHHAYIINASAKPVYRENHFETPYLRPNDIIKTDHVRLEYTLYIENSLNEQAHKKKYYRLTNTCLF